MRAGFFLSLLVFSFAARGEATPVYGWPLQDNYGISATFGESRDDHFHAGIDLSTNGDTGLPVLAIEAGEVYRMKVQKRGYGRALYIRHANGMISVYGHLEKYSSELGLEQMYQQKIIATGQKYVGDIFVDPPVRVERGTIVAFSGETGAGLPHLHLELRRTENVPVNPLANGLEDSLDPVAPSFQAAYLYPASGTAPIDGELDTQVVRFSKDDAGYMADHTPVVRGDFYVSVSTYDAALRPYHRNPYRISYSIDQQAVYEMTFNEFSYTAPEHFGLVYDLAKPGPAYYEYPIFLANPKNANLPFANERARVSIRNLKPGLHRLQIDASDTSGNQSSAFLDFLVNQPPAVRVENLAAEGSDLMLGLAVQDPDWKLAPPSGLAGEVEFSTDKGKTFVPFPSVSLNMQASGDAAHFVCRTPLNSITTLPVLVKIRGYDGVEYSPYTVIELSSLSPPAVQQLNRAPGGSLSVKKYADAVKVEFNTDELVTYPLELSDGTRTYPMNSWNLTSYSAIIQAPAAKESLALNLSNAQQSVIPLHFLNREEPASVRGEGFELSLETGTLYSDAFVWPDMLPAYKTRYLYPVTPLLQLGPRGLPFKKDARLTFHYPASTIAAEHLSIYRWGRASQKWQSLPSVVEKSTHTISTKISYLDLYAVIYDNVAPVVKHIFPKRNSVTSNDTPLLAAVVSDAGMEIDDDRVTFFIDGTPHAADYDPDRNLATYKVEQPLHKGYHRFWVQAYDWGGNKTVTPPVSFRVR